jgi:hypothetical protein
MLRTTTRAKQRECAKSRPDQVILWLIVTPRVCRMASGGVRDGSLPRYAWLPVGLVAVTTVTLLLVTSGRYGYHRDELYFRLIGAHPSWGYVDQPPFTPLVSRLSILLFGDNLLAVRLPAILATGALVFLVALVAREIGGTATGQTLAALGVPSAFPLAGGHVLLTVSFDVPVWVLVSLFVIRALRRAEPNWWLAAGATVGLALYNKHLVLLLLVGLAAGLLAVGPRRALLEPRLWLGLGLAVVIGLPNLLYQVLNGFPQLQMADALARDKGGDARPMLLPGQALLLGPPLVAIWVTGIVAVLRRPAWRPLRAFPVAYGVILVLLAVLAGQFYYVAGLLLVLFAFGAVATADWLRRARWRAWATGALVAVNVAVSAVIVLPLLPETVLGRTPIPGINQTAADQVGWPRYVAQVAAVYRSLPESQRSAAVLLTGNYGEAGALDRFRAEFGLPVAYSGQNELYHLRRPPESATTAVVVLQGERAEPFLAGLFDDCRVAGTLDNGVGVDNEEQGTPIRVCTGPKDDWAALWPRWQHFD